MSKKSQVYKCDICGSIVNVLHGGAGTLVCCNQPMTLQTENTTDAATEKHVPVVKKIDSGYEVVVGSVEHPMSEEHHIEWVELIADGISYFKYFTPEESPVATFITNATDVKVRAYCNLHGLWSS
ncbi:MAG: desulfoferrodoxin [Acidobacteriota bacterium]